MALTLFEAAKQSRNPLTAGVLLAIATSDEMISQLPMVRKQGESFVYNREKALPGAEFVSPTHTSLTSSNATFDRVTVPLRLIVTDVDTYMFAEQQQGELIAQRSLQVQQKLKSVGRTIAEKAINGQFATSAVLSPAMAGVAYGSVSALQDSDRRGPGELFYDQSEETLAYRAPGDRTFGPAVSTAGDPGSITLVSDNPSQTITVAVASTAALPAGDATASVTFASTTDEPDGLKGLVSASQTIDSDNTNGDALSFGVLDNLIDSVKTQNNLRLIMNSALRRKYYELVRGLGGTDPTHTTLPGISGPVPTYRGVPILRNDNVLGNEAKGSASTLSSAYCVDMVEEEGFYAGVGGSGSAEAALTPMTARIMGVQIRDVGELEDKEAMRTRVSWYGAFALGSNLAVARARELITL